MTNKHERFLVMSEAEYRQALFACLMRSDAMKQFPIDHEVYKHWQAEFDKAEAACRARPVPEWATHFALFDEEHPYYTPDDHEAWVTKSWRIEK